NVTLSFDEPVSTVGIQTNVAIRGSISGAIGYSVSTSANVATLTPNQNFARSEVITVTVSGSLQSAAGSALYPPVGSLQFSVFPNRVPVAVNETFTTLENTPLTPSASILTNDTDADGDPLTVGDIVYRGDLGALWIRFGFGITTTYEGGT